MINVGYWMTPDNPFGCPISKRCISKAFLNEMEELQNNVPDAMDDWPQKTNNRMTIVFQGEDTIQFHNAEDLSMCLPIPYF